MRRFIASFSLLQQKPAVMISVRQPVKTHKEYKQHEISLIIWHARIHTHTQKHRTKSSIQRARKHNIKCCNTL